MIETVLGYLLDDSSNKVLMLYRDKKKNDLNEGKWIGVGGHIEKDELPLNALKREFKEETGLNISNISLRGKILFINDSYKELMYLYTIKGYDGNLITCDEGELKLIDKSKILDLNIWEGDRVFLNILFNESTYFELNLYYKNNKFIGSERIK